MTVDVETDEAVVQEEVRTPGALLAVCGICGGAGTSTLAFLTAMQVQRFAPEPVLLCDTGGPTASLALLAGKASPLSLPHAASAIAADALGVPLFVPLTSRLRMIAREPDVDDPPDPEGLARLLSDARDAHPVTVADCGTLQRPIEQTIAGEASSILWVARGTQTGVRRARAALRSLPLRAEREILAVCTGEDRDTAVEHELMSVADLRGASLVFMPPLPDAFDDGLKAALAGGQVALEAIRTRLT